MIDLDAARAILRSNDLGGYTVPTRGLYPFQWNWDSAIIALGWHCFDEGRAWHEARTMFDGQWDNGLLPHILFHSDSDSYFPGSEVWGANSRIPSSTVSQPPVWALAIAMMLDRSKASAAARAEVEALLPKLLAHHRWWYRDRDLGKSGLVETYHPWESGMDNSPAWDAPLARVPRVEWEYQRRDLGHVDECQRPSHGEYDRYLYLIEFLKHNHADPRRMSTSSPFRVVDLTIVSILHRATRELVSLCQQFGLDSAIPDLEVQLARTRAAMSGCWSEDHRCFLNRDKVSGTPLAERTTASLLPLFGLLASERQASQMASLIEEWLAASRFSLASTHPESPRYEPTCYWRGPVWLHINWMIADGLTAYGYDDLAREVRAQSIKCIEAAGGYFEYYGSETGEGCGGGEFSWTAAVALFWLAGE
ncbi:MAG: trehalase family glycosidase [Gammaproteobacteria bacterium]|nr:trehalase family glycosidase [Gammaproteobacteria bacterium]